MLQINLPDQKRIDALKTEVILQERSAQNVTSSQKQKRKHFRKKQTNPVVRHLYYAFPS